MTTFIIHGGNTRQPCENNQRFFETIAKCSGRGKTLIIPYALQEREWDRYFQEVKLNASAVAKPLHLVLASSNHMVAIQQIMDAEVLYFTDGSDVLLHERTKSIAGFSALVKDKVIVGSAAGANIFATYFYAQAHQQIQEGLRLLPIKLITHYQPQMQHQADMLNQFKEHLDLFTLADTEFRVFTVG